MQTSKIVSIEDGLIDEIKREQIERFLCPKKRNQVFMTLADRGELSQGDLAIAVGATATSLANLLAKFKDFEYNLLDTKNIGRYKYYMLSGVGRAYYATIRRTEQNRHNPAEAEKGNALCMDAQVAIENFRLLSLEGEWRTEFSLQMGKLILGITPEAGERSEALRRYLRSVELLTLRGRHEDVAEVLNLLPDESMRGLVDRFMSCFEPFKVVIDGVGLDERTFAIYRLIEAAFCGKEEKAVEQYIKEVGWEHSKYNELSAEAVKLRRNFDGCGEQEIYNYLGFLLPDQWQLRSYIALCACDRVDGTMGRAT